jgi:Zn-dependent M28 family amino/carboxypeptidase
VVAGSRVGSALGIPADSAGVALPRRLGGRATLTVGGRSVPVAGANLVGRLDGAAGPEGEFVALVAHYDHIGVGRPIGGDSIYNGFMDDAVGVAAVLETARILARENRRRPLPRGLLVLLTTAEESGALGSAYYVDRPPVPLARTAAVITIDLPAPLAPPNRWILEGNSDRLVRLARDAVRSRGWTITGAPALPNSDHLNFIARGVPTVFVVADSGWEGLTPAAEEAAIEKWWHPHDPRDEWHPDFPASGLRRQVELLVLLATAYARMPPER